MGNLNGGNMIGKLREGLGVPQAQPAYQPGIVSSMLARGEDPNTLPKKSFLGGKGWKPPSPTWSPWDMWTAEDAREGSLNASRSLSNAIRLTPESATSTASSIRALPQNPGDGIVSNAVSAQPVPTTNPVEVGQTATPAPKKKRKNRSFSPYGTAPSSMGTF